ncbi:hypothetical protein D3C71_1931710 [compost metagenome]
MLAAFERLGRDCSLFIAHDLDQDNLALLRQRRIHFVLHHDLRSDARMTFRAILARRSGAGQKLGGSRLSAVEVITPYNVPII